jgi:hypothetical protein
MIPRDHAQYTSLLQSLARISRLFSNSESAYIDSRFAEKLFTVTTGATDLGRKDISFDALFNRNVGVGIKTFAVDSGSSSTEKVAEFTTLARQDHFKTSNKKLLVERVAKARNTRISSNIAEYGIDINQCVYHCLIRFPGGAVVHEEPYQLIDLEKLRPLNRGGRTVKDWTDMGNGVYFTDGLSKYSYSTSKNVLMKSFEFDRAKNFIPLEIHSDPLDLLDQLVGRPSRQPRKILPPLLTMGRDRIRHTKGVDYVVLPLYSTRTMEIPEKSGINQWNAGGRARKFGEAYIAIPKEIHHRYPDFFPKRDHPFDLLLPNGLTVQRAKVCQDGGKALMTHSNIELGRWLISVIDPSVKEKEFDAAPKSRRPYRYSDLVTIGADSVIVRKKNSLRAGEDPSLFDAGYSIEFASLGAYENFIED